ncbi:MAG: HD domain-containing protein [Lachnospiraceae bacterium]|nr:HD domain-containing protein [Lachnospiraceae bacterium]
MARTDDLRRYAELSEWIRELSMPSLEGITNAEEYFERIRANYERMRDLNRTSSAILEEQVLPLLPEEEGTLVRPLTEAEAKELFAFCGILSDPVNLESVDDVLRYKIVRLLLADAEAKNDTAAVIRALDILIECCYFLMTSAAGLWPESEKVEEYRKIGLDASMRLRAYLDKEAFAALPDTECKEIVLVNARYISALYECVHAPWTEEENREHLEQLKEALRLSEDAFYIEQASKFDWKRHRYRSLQGIASLAEYHNEAGFTEEQLKEINGYTRQLLALWKEDKVLYGALSAPEVLYLPMYRNAYLAGEMPLAEYRASLLSIIEGADEEDFSHDGNMMIVFAQTEYLLTLDKEHLTEEEKKRIRGFFDRLVHYVSRMPKLGSLTFLVGFLTRSIDALAACGEGVDYAHLAARLLAAVNPPTWCHSLTVAELAECITGHLYDREPSLFRDTPGYPDKAAVTEFLRQAALVHDTGKIFIAEFITNYAREYFPDEQAWLELFPRVGARILERFPDTRPYAEIVRHHLDENWDKDIATQILSYADRMGWTARDTTDTGRAMIPFIDALCREKDIEEELNRIVTEGRIKNMAAVYTLLTQEAET